MAKSTALVKAPRTVIGYHGCTRESADRILAESRFLPSARAYDWLGEGIYFWEYAPYRALEWAIIRCSHLGGEPAVLGATLRLGRCMNLLDTAHAVGLMDAYTRLSLHKLPQNLSSGAHFLDR